MNPHVTIKPWLLGCGKYFGANEAHEYRWPDADGQGRPEVKYFTYVMRAARLGKGRSTRRDERSGSYDVLRQREQAGTVDVEITLYNDPEGLDDLAGCVVALADQTFRNLFYRENVGLEKDGLLGDIEDVSEYDDDRVYYKHKMKCRFTCKYGYQHLRQNEVIDEVILDDPFGQET